MKSIRWFRKKSRAQLLGYFYAMIFTVVILSFGWGLYRVAVYAANTSRLEIRNVSFSGLKRVSKGEILSRASWVMGTNILRVDLEETRHAVEQIVWVKHATIQRVWPDEMVITVEERQPVAVARIDGDIFQVDIDGVVLGMASMQGADFPVLDGLRPADLIGNRRKIEAYIETVETVGQTELSEVYVSDIGEVTVVPVAYPILIDLGMSDHRARWEKFVQLRGKIQEDYPDAFLIDLRFKDQVIIRSEGNEPSRKVIWGEEKKLS